MGLRYTTFLASAATLLTAAVAGADSSSFAVDHLQLSTGGGDFVATESAGHLRPWDWRVGVAYGYADRPLVLQTGSVRDVLISARSTMELNGAVELGRYFGIGVSLPAIVDQRGSAIVDHAVLGDLRLAPRFDLARGRLGLSVIAEVRLPTGAVSQFFGEGMAIFEPRLAAEVSLGMVRLGANLGVRVRQERQYVDLSVGNELFASLAASVAPRPYLALFGELHADTAMSARFGEAQRSPVEALLGASGGARGLKLTAAVGVGVVDGFGTPRVRALLTLEYRRPSPAATARPALLARRFTPKEDDDLTDLEAAEDDEDAAEEDPPLAAAAPLPSDSPTEPAVHIANGRVELAQPIFFKLNRKRIRTRFRDELLQLVRVLNRRSDIARVWIEGHADATGPERWNLELSRSRAEVVARFLEREGVDASRLAPVGFGEARPLVPAVAGEPNERNRRVHFFTDTGAPVAPAALSTAEANHL